MILAVSLLAVAIGVRLYQIQVVQAAALRERARSQHQTRVEIGGGRGLILDRTGRELAVSVETSSLFVHPQRLARDEERREAARLLSPRLGLSRKSILERLDSDEPFVWLKRRLDPETVRRIEELDLPVGPGAPFGFKPEPKRFYPRGKLAVHVVGFSNIDQVGVEGIERRFNDVLQSDSATYVAVRDGLGRTVLQLFRPAVRAPEDIVLALDAVLQHIVERELDRAMRETGCRTASAILIEPSTGQVLALANRPAADPNHYGAASSSARRNRAVVDVYEPGSTFKIVTAAAALDSRTAYPEQRFDCGRGSTLVAGHRIRDTHPYDALTFREILEKSSNVGISKIGRALEPEVFHDYIVRFGFAERTGIGLPGERRGLLRPVSRWSALSPASLSFGQEIGVTVLQMAAAFAAVANDGVYVPPRVVLGKRDADGRFVRFPPPEARRVIDSRTARTLTGMLEGVIHRGTGSRAAVAGHALAGKTGTAQKAMPVGGYSPTDYVASFGGFGPVRAPRLAAMIVLDSPKGDRHQGGQVAAPIFGRIMAEALAHLRVPPDHDPLRRFAAAPDERGVPGARDRLRAFRFDERDRLATGPGQVPDVRGLSLREAVSMLADRGCRAHVQGSGIVYSQSPRPGTGLEEGQTCSIRLYAPTARARPAGSGARSSS